MYDPKSPKPGLSPGTPAPAKPAAPAARPVTPGVPSARPQAGKGPAAPPSAAPARPTGRVRHDERGNAVWDWLSQTSRICIEATSRLLKKLETPELKIETKMDEELRIMPEPSTGGGYNPYEQGVKPPPKAPPKGRK